MEWDTEKDYEIINTMKIFMGENEGRKLFFDTYIPRKYTMQSQHSIFDKLNLFLGEEKKKWDGKNPLLLVITYENHYTAIRVDPNNTVTLFDPNYNNSLYEPITKKMRKDIEKIFGSKPIDYKYTCQITNDEADSFCQTWALYLLTDPKFKPYGGVAERFSFILKIYKNILKTCEAKTVYREFLKLLIGLPYPEHEYLSIADFTHNRFIKAMYATQKDYRKAFPLYRTGLKF